MAQRLAQRPVRVVIIGAGIGGLAAAVALRQRGIEVQLYERSARLEEVGAGIQIRPNAAKVLRALGLEEELRRNAFEPTNMVSLKWDDASLRHREPLKATATAKYGAPYMTAHRADLHGLLRAALPERIIQLGANCTGATTVNGTAIARFADGNEVEGDAVIGADSFRSAIRAELFGADQPRFTEMMCWRAMVPMACAPTRIGPGRSVTLDHGEYFGWIGPDGHVICYPIGNGDTLNIFAGHITEKWVEESWSVASSREELLAAYEGWNEALLGLFRHVANVFKWGIYDRDPLPEWTKGRVTLLGDAAHPTTPTLAQGGNMAIEDGYVLARNLARHGSDIATALQSYVAERQPRTSRVTLQSRQQFANNRKVPPPPFLDRSWIFTFDATREATAHASA
jgi:salicylate hydroxylase